MYRLSQWIFVLFTILLSFSTESSGKALRQWNELRDVKNDSVFIWLLVAPIDQKLFVLMEGAPHASGDYIIVTKNPPNANQDRDTIVARMEPKGNANLMATNVVYSYKLSKNVTKETSCYGYWAAYKNKAGQILATSCLKAYPRWMNDMSATIGNLNLKELFIPGSHDAGAYKPNFKPHFPHETIVTKAVYTQDEEIKGQLMHGVRYLDIRIAYYDGKFFINHGQYKVQPLSNVINEVKDFVQETNEIVIFGIKEFPVGFKDISIHRLLVDYLKKEFGSLIVSPSLTWNAKLNDIWSRKQNVILAYDLHQMVQERPDVLFRAVDQRWGDVRSWKKLEQYLRSVNSNVPNETPVADMAELTPSAGDVILQRSLRQMADEVNVPLSFLYRNELGEKANIVAVDFLRGTLIADLAIEINSQKHMRQ